MQGSLIGFAGQGTIDNCAVAGYKVVDNRTVDGHGDANVGGFIGFSSTDITNCSSVNEVEINATHSKGINIRVGGLAGICTGTIKNSYCGGSIKSGTKQNVAIYVAGIMGGEWFKGAGLKNLTNIDSFETDADKIKPKLENCYSYVRLPAANFNENRIVYVKVLATVADLDKEALKVLRNAGIINYTESAADPATIEIKNCYYYAAYAGTATNVERHYAKGTIYDVSYLDANGTAIAGGSAATVMGLTYRKMNDELLGKLNAKAQYFKPVTTTENGGVDIKGKYSFPGSDKELQGENYPFPTIITQSNPFYDEDMAGTTESPTVNVHYGEWPKSNGLFIDKASDSIDLLTSASGITEVNIKYYVDGNPVSMDAGTQPGISYSLGTTSDIINCTLTHKTDENGIGYYTLAAEALREGYETITLSYTADGKEYKNAVDISVNAEYVIVITPRVSTNSEIYVGKSVDYILEAYNSSGNKLSLTAANWTADVTDEESEEFINCGKPKDVDGEVVITVTGVSEGTAYISVGTKGITSLTGKPIEGQSRIMTAEVEADPNAAATMVTAMLYSDGMRLGSSSDRPVSVAYATSAGNDAKAGSNLSYWTGVVAGNASEGTGKSFAGWVTEDGESFTSATELNSTVKVMASWECLSISFMDKAEGAGDYTELTRLSYYGGNLYTDNTLSTSAAAPEPYKRSGSDSFSGYWTEPNGGEMIVSSEGALTKTLPNSGSMKLYARFDVSAEELAALARKKSEEDKAAAEAMSAEPAEKAITDAVSGEITEG